MSEQEKYKDQAQKQDQGSLELQKIISELETQATTGKIGPTLKHSMSGTSTSNPVPEPDEDIQKTSFIEPTRPEILVVTTKIHSFDKPVFITMPKCKVYTILGNIPVLRTPEVSTEYIEMHVINDDELGYSIPQYDSEEDDYGIIFDDGGAMSMLNYSICVVCGKKFGTRKLDALASILLKLNAQQIIVQKYSYNRNNKSAQWVPEYNKQVTKLEHHIHKFLRNDEQ